MQSGQAQEETKTPPKVKVNGFQPSAEGETPTTTTTPAMPAGGENTRICSAPLR